MLRTYVPKPNGLPGVAPPLRIPTPERRIRIAWIWALALLLLAAILAVALFFSRGHNTVSYSTVPLQRTDLVQTVTASGTVNAQNTVSVGTQVSGTIQSIYVDFNSRVHTGQILARIDPSQFSAERDQARAALAQARAQATASRESAGGAAFSVDAASAALASARAGVPRAQAALLLARQTLSRDRALLSRGYISQSQYDADYSSAVAADMSLRAAQAAVSQNAAQRFQASAGASGSISTAAAAASAIQAAQAVVQQDELNLQRTTITSPVNGTIVARNVSVGQTVAASFQTPTLFTIAEDLRKMEVDIAVGEPDIGNVQRGQSVRFSVLAYPLQTFTGRVSQVRVNPTTISNVVTYTVVVLVDNKTGRLLPGMTANASIAVARAAGALVVPTQALGYRPARAARSGAVRQSTALSPWGATANDVSGAVVAGTNRTLYVLRNGKPVAIPVRVDLVSGTQAAITPKRLLSENEAIILSDNSSTRNRSAAAAGNPAFGVGRIR